MTCPVGSGRAETSEIPWSIESYLSGEERRSSRFRREEDIVPAATCSFAAYFAVSGTQGYGELTHLNVTSVGRENVRLRFGESSLNR